MSVNAYPGGCHCGNIRYRLVRELEPSQWAPRVCQCNYCTKIGAAYVSGDSLDIKVLYASLIDHYRFATKTAEFLRCKKCGVVPVVIDSNHHQLLGIVNVRTLDEITFDASQFKVMDYAGESNAQRARRRAQAWTPNTNLEFINA